MLSLKVIVIISMILLLCVLYYIKSILTNITLKIEKNENSTRKQIFMLSEKVDESDKLIQELKEQNIKLNELYMATKNENYIARLNEEPINLKLDYENEEIIKTSEMEELSPNGCFVLYSCSKKDNDINEKINEIYENNEKQHNKTEQSSLSIVSTNDEEKKINL